MRTEIRDVDDQVIGTFTLDANGAAVLDAQDLAPRLADLTVIAPGLARTPSRPVLPDEGEAYLRALPDALRGPYLSAVFVEA